MVKTQFWFQSWLNLWIGSGTNQIWNIQTKQPSVSNQNNTMFPWLSQKYIDEIEERTKSITNYADKVRVQQAMYSDYIAKQENDDNQKKRATYKNETIYKANNTKDKKEKNVLNASVRSADLADMIREKYNISLNAGSDDEITSYFIEQVDNWDVLLQDYLNWKSNELLYKTWLSNRPKEETFGQKMADLWVWILQSPWKRWYNLIWQWIDKKAKEAAWYLEWSKLQERVREKAIEYFGEDAVNDYIQQAQTEEEQWTEFNGRTQTDITKPLLWEERAESGWTKAWEVIWDIASGIALTAPASAALAPVYASASVPWALWVWALEWLADTAVATMWSEWDLPTVWEAITWAWLGAIWWAFSRYLAQPKASANQTLKKEAAPYIEKSIKPTVKWKQNTTDYNKFIDNTLDSIDAMVENKQWLQYTDDAWETVKWEMPKNMRQFSEAIDSLKRHVYSAYDDIAKQAWDAGAKVNLNKLYQQLDDIADDTAYNMANPWWNKMVEQYKDILLQYTDDAWNITMDQATKLVQDYNNLLKAFFKNPNMNDVSKNAIIAQMNKWVKTAINDWIDDALWNAIQWWSKMSQQYTELKQLYGKLVSIEDEVSKRALVLARKNTKWLSDTMLDAFAAWDITEALLSLNAWKLAKWTAIKLIWKIYKWLNDPDYNLSQLINIVEKSKVKPSAVSQAVKNTAQNIWQSVKNVAQKWTNATLESISNAVMSE